MKRKLYEVMTPSGGEKYELHLQQESSLLLTEFISFDLIKLCEKMCLPKTY